MGSYTDLTIGGYPILNSKSFVIQEVMTLFQESDKRIAILNEDDQDEVVVTYSCEVAKVIDRLDVMGFTMRRLRNEFEATRSWTLRRRGALSRCQ